VKVPEFSGSVTINSVASVTAAEIIIAVAIELSATFDHIARNPNSFASFDVACLIPDCHDQL
jgi:hypothetical protein